MVIISSQSFLMASFAAAFSMLYLPTASRDIHR